MSPLYSSPMPCRPRYTIGAPAPLPITGPTMPENAPPQTLAARIATLQDTHGGEFERQPQSDGSVVVRLKQSSGEVLAASGATTADAVAALETRVTAFAAALAAGA